MSEKHSSVKGNSVVGQNSAKSKKLQKLSQKEKLQKQLDNLDDDNFGNFSNDDEQSDEKEVDEEKQDFDLFQTLKQAESTNHTVKYFIEYVKEKISNYIITNYKKPQEQWSEYVDYVFFKPKTNINVHNWVIAQEQLTYQHANAQKFFKGMIYYYLFTDPVNSQIIDAFSQQGQVSDLVTCFFSVEGNNQYALYYLLLLTALCTSLRSKLLGLCYLVYQCNSGMAMEKKMLQVMMTIRKSIIGERKASGVSLIQQPQNQDKKEEQPRKMSKKEQNIEKKESTKDSVLYECRFQKQPFKHYVFDRTESVPIYGKFKACQECRFRTQQGAQNDQNGFWMTSKGLQKVGASNKHNNYKFRPSKSEKSTKKSSTGSFGEYCTLCSSCQYGIQQLQKQFQARYIKFCDKYLTDDAKNSAMNTYQLMKHIDRLPNFNNIEFRTCQAKKKSGSKDFKQTVQFRFNLGDNAAISTNVYSYVNQAETVQFFLDSEHGLLLCYPTQKIDEYDLLKSYVMEESQPIFIDDKITLFKVICSYLCFIAISVTQLSQIGWSVQEVLPLRTFARPGSATTKSRPQNKKTSKSRMEI